VKDALADSSFSAERYNYYRGILDQIENGE
jgi:hypothetical protein